MRHVSRLRAWRQAHPLHADAMLGAFVALVGTGAVATSEPGDLYVEPVQAVVLAYEVGLVLPAQGEGSAPPRG